VRAVTGIALDVQAGECLAVVGESGSGKTQLLLACLGLLADNGQASGSVLLSPPPMRALTCIFASKRS
jgi:ABC-type glutathione transport system ATPase component